VFNAEFGAEVDLELDRWLSGFGEGSAAMTVPTRISSAAKSSMVAMWQNL
jgi:hypothetical protein